MVNPNLHPCTMRVKREQRMSSLEWEGRRGMLSLTKIEGICQNKLILGHPWCKFGS